MGYEDGRGRGGGPSVRTPEWPSRASPPLCISTGKFLSCIFTSAGNAYPFSNRPENASPVFSNWQENASPVFSNWRENASPAFSNRRENALTAHRLTSQRITHRGSEGELPRANDAH